MKKIIYGFTFFLLSFCSFGQAPQSMNYQAVARDAAGAILPNQNICIQSTITNGLGGPVLYQETFNTTTNQFGLFALAIGNGVAVTGTFSSINWGNVTAWQTIDMKIGCTGSYVTMGSSQLMSVPYALSSPITNLLHTGGISSVVRNADVVSSDSIVITETGDYLILFEIAGGNQNQYVNSAIYDNIATIYLELLPSYQLSNYLNMFQEIGDANGGNFTIRYLSAQATTTTKTHLFAGNVLKEVARVNSVGVPTGNWGVTYNIELIKLK